MRVIEEKIKINKFESNIFNTYFKDMSLCVFDIESMGLGPRTSEMILTCFLEVKDDGYGYLKQFFLDSMEEEPLLLMKTINELNKYDVILTYNGISFDIPFVRERAKRLGIRDIGVYDTTIHPFNLDLFPTVNRYSNLNKILKSLSQKSLENYLQIDSSRKDEISGKESIDLFKQYLTTKDFDYRDKLGNKILLHNHDDVIQLYKLLDIIKQVDFHKSRFKMGYPIKGINGWNNLHVLKMDIKSQTLIISGIHHEKNFKYISFDISTNFSSDGTFIIEIPLNKLNNAQFVNLRDFFDSTGNFEPLKGFVNGYLILKDKDEINYKEINLFTKEILINIIKKIRR